MSDTCEDAMRRTRFRVTAGSEASLTIPAAWMMDRSPITVRAVTIPSLSQEESMTGFGPASAGRSHARFTFRVPVMITDIMLYGSDGNAMYTMTVGKDLAAGDTFTVEATFGDVPEKKPAAPGRFDLCAAAWVRKHYGVVPDLGSVGFFVDAAAYASGAWCNFNVRWAENGIAKAAEVSDSFDYDATDLMRELTETEPLEP